MPNLAKEFATEISNTLFFAPKPTSRNRGFLPDDLKVTVTENIINVAWLQETRFMGEYYNHNINFSILIKNGKWFFSSPVNGNVERFSWWPNFVQNGKVGEEFSMEKFLSYYRVEKSNVDWSKV